MGLIYAEIELVNPGDLALVRRGYLKESEIRRENVKALVDRGAYMLCINEHLKAQLDLPAITSAEAELADGTRKKVEVVGPVMINFKNRTTSCNAAVLPGDAEVLLGAIPMEDLDVVLVPKEQTIDVNPDSPYLAKKKLKAVKSFQP
jgi:clan AA aspartic protease